LTGNRWRLGLFVAGLLVFGPARGVVLAQAPGAEQPISPQALAQIEALAQEKAARTPAERKISSQLLYAIKMQRGQQIAPGVQLRPPRVTRGPDGRIDVDVTARAGTNLNALLLSRGADVLGVNTTTRGAGGSVARAHIDADSVLALAARSDVLWVRPHQEYKLSSPTPLVPKFRRRAGAPPPVDDVSPGTRRIERALQGVVASTAEAFGVRRESGQLLINAVPSGQGSRESEGDATHQANIARGAFGIDGTGVKIGVLSDGVASLAVSQTAGDLGVVTVLPGQAGTGDEGTAMLEIIHDLAPGAQLFFASGFSSITQFAQNIRDLRTAGCDIIVDDLAYYAESPFQDGQTSPSSSNGGVVTQAVNDVTASGALYFSSAGNEGNVNDGTGGAWEGDFVNGGTPIPILAGGGLLLDFGGGQAWNSLTSGGSLGVSLYWSDPLNASGNDYDLYILNSAGTTILAASTDLQDGDDDPYEQTDPANSGERVVVAQFAGADRFLHVNVNRGTLSIQTPGQTHGHNAAAAAFSVAATPAAASFYGPDPGPYPNAFTAANKVEGFSSDGPRRLFFQANGTPFTPGNVSSTGGILRQKPDITAADGVQVTGAGGFSSPFYGTSASAPHAGAIAALLKQARPDATPTQIRTWLTSTALDIETPGVDRDAGAGIIMAVPALQAAGATGTALLAVDSQTVSENPGNGDGQLYGGEGGKLTVVLKNAGVAAATAISATLTTSTPGVTVTLPATRPFADLAPSATASHAIPFTFTLASNADCGLTIDFTLTVSLAGGESPQVIPISVPTGVLEITGVFDATPPSASPFYTATAGTQTGRVSRDGVASTCAAPKAYPGTLGGATLGYEAYAFTTCAASPVSCAQVSLAGPAGVSAPLFATTYGGSFDPANVATNYLADLGESHVDGAFAPYSVSLPAGSQTFVVDINEITPGSATGATYGLRVSGVCLASCTRNQVPVAVVHNVIVAAGPGGSATATIDNGSNDADGEPLTIVASPAGPYPVGTTTVLLTVTDGKGATSQATAMVTVLPAVTALAPAQGASSGGTVVTITGSGFDTTPGGTAVTFGGVAATGVVCASSVTCQATSPAGTGAVSVRVTVAGQTSADTAADDFTYGVAPTITALTPAAGALAGGTIVTISGTGFSTTPGATTVMFGAVAATNISCASATECVATSPAGTGTVSVRATVDGKTSADTAADDFAYATQVYLLADGATGTFFDEDVLIANANMVDTPVTLTFLKENGSTITDARTIAAQSRATVHVDAIPGLESTSAAAIITSENGLPLAVERSMFWDASYYAGHAASALAAPATQWYFAEGAQGFFDTFVLVNNPNATPADVTFTFLREHETPVVKTVTVGGTTRYTLEASSLAELRTRSFAIVVSATQPVTADRAMYFGSTATQLWGGGTASAGSALAAEWFFAEGATGSFFDTFFLLGNPQNADAHVTVTYLLDSGEVVTVPKTVPARERLTINPETGGDARLKSAAFATMITSDIPIVSERSMYWSGKALPWGEAHNSAGLTAPALTWDLAEGRIGGEHKFRTYILVANPGATSADVTVTYLRETGAPVVKTYSVAATSRLTIDTSSVTELANESFGARITVTNHVPVIVERSMYWNANGVFWSGGSSGTGIRVP
jgi:hypothetical protein